MKYPKVKIDPTRFKWAIGLTDVNKEKIYAKFPKLNKWSSGEDEPSMKELSDFSLMTRVPL